MKTVAIIQARMGSTRLPGKVLMDIGGRTMLARVVERTRRARRIEAVVVAATAEPRDDAIVEECRRLDVPVTRGSVEDVLDRYRRAATDSSADPIVRITSDCPLLEPAVVDQVVEAFQLGHPDYASNVLERTFPQGLDVEVVGRAALERAWNAAKQPYERVHVTPYIYQHPDVFRLLGVRADGDYGGYRWTVDTAEDLAFVREVYARLGADGRFGWRDILQLLENEPHLLELNRHVRQKALEEG